MKRPSELNVKTIKEEGSAILRVNCEAVVAHRTILADVSPFFYTMFYGSFRENEEFFVDLTQIFQTSENLTNIINFMFGADISVTETNVSDFLAGAEFFTVPDIKVMCFEFLLENLTLQNCLWTWSLADLYSLEGLGKICQEFAISRFHYCLIHHEGTFFCPPGHMISFLNKGLAMLCSRKDIKTFIDKYVQFADSNKRFKNELQECARRSKEMGKEVTENLVLDEENDDIDLTELPESVPAMQRNVSTESQEIRKQTTTECLIYQENEGSIAMYSPVFGKWYRLEFDSFDSFDSFDCELVSVGLGVENNHLLLKDNYKRYILYEIDTNKIRPILPLMKHLPLNMYRAEIFCSMSEVYRLSFTRYFGTRGRLKTKINLHKYELKTNKWRWLCNVEESKEFLYYPVHILPHINEMVYIFVLKPTRINLYQFSGLTEKIQRLGQFISKTVSESELLQSKAYGSPTKLGIELELMTVIYDLEMKIWEVNENSEFTSINKNRGRFKVISNKRNEGYSIRNGVLNSVVHFTVTKGGTEIRLPTLPSLREYSSLSILRVPWKLLERLKSPEYKIKIDEPLCTIYKRIYYQEVYREKHLSQGKISTDSEEDIEDKIEDTEEYAKYAEFNRMSYFHRDGYQPFHLCDVLEACPISCSHCMKVHFRQLEYSQN